MTGKLRLMRNLEELATYLLSYVSETENRTKIIALLEAVYKSFNTYTHAFKSYLDPYYTERLADIPEIIGELNKIQTYATENPHTNVEFLNRYWLVEIVKFFNHDKWDKETRPSVMFLRSILREFTRYDQNQPLPLGLPMETLYQSFYEQACVQAKEYIHAEEQKHVLKRALKTIKHKEAIIIPEVVKSYTAPRRQQFDYVKRADLLNVKNSLNKIFITQPEGKPATTHLQKPRVIIHVAKEPGPNKFQGSLFDEMREKKFKTSKEADLPSLSRPIMAR